MPSISNFLKKLEVKGRTDGIYEEYGTTRWGNRDLYPIVPSERTYTARAYFAYWVTTCVCINAWTLGSSLIGYGLTAGQTMGAIVIGSVFAALMAVLCGQVGRNLHLGYPMMGRASFGLYGSYFVVLVKCLVSLIFFGFNAYYGGQAIVLILSALSKSFMNMKNSLPSSAAITTRDFVGFFLYFVIFIPIIFIPPHKLHRFLYPSFVLVTVTMFGILGWALHANGGPGNLVAPAFAISKTEAGFRMLQGITNVASSWTGSAVRGSDWTRYAKTRNAPILSQLLTPPITITLCALLGVLVTSAANEMYGEVMWNPLSLLQYVQQTQYTAACRAGTFFAGIGVLSSQLFVNTTQNIISSGMDLAGLAPKYIDMYRGGLFFTLLGLVIQPWRFFTQAATFVTVISSFGVFIAPIAGIIIADFWVVRRQKWKIPDLYQAGGIYWYTCGLNWRAFLCFIISAALSMPGFGAAVSSKTIAVGWQRIFMMNYLVGLLLGIISFVLLNLVFPPRGLGIEESLDGVIDGVQHISHEINEMSPHEDSKAEAGVAIMNT